MIDRSLVLDTHKDTHKGLSGEASLAVGVGPGTWYGSDTALLLAVGFEFLGLRKPNS